MNEIIDDMYPILIGRLHLDSENPYIVDFLDEKIRTRVNKTGARILSFCNGSITFKEIVNKIYVEYNIQSKSQEIETGIKKFIIESTKLGFLRLEKEEKNIVPVITGSFDFYTPEAMQIELTQQCPLRCRHCYVYAAPEKVKRMSYEVANRILDQASEMGVSNIVLTGGDPMMHPQFWDLFERATNFHNVNLLTSGYLIDQKAARRIADYRNVSVQISVDGIAETHNSFRGKSDAFKRTIKAFEFLQNYNAKVIWAMTVTPNNISELEECIKFAKELGTGRFRPSIVYHTGRATKESLDNDIAFVRRLKHEIVHLQKKYNTNDFRVDGLEGSNGENIVIGNTEYENINCGAGWSFCHITAKGELLACPVFPYKMADLHSVDLKDCFIEKDEFIRNLNTPKKSICKGCPNLEKDYGCHAHGFISSQSNPKCTWVKQIDSDLSNQIKQGVYSP
ncbi:radical SAM protein [Pseudobacillus badius]|uniref:radical SAM protein n=1 Tax=Bacillus badius TaxID=1455 RepID=UPI003CF00C60